jgi:ABC-type Fe3+/spermidine/putrescine transport system ATPase subunit
MLNIEKVTKRFGSTAAVSNVSLDIAAGEFFSLLGPSGCGKTTLLRTIAGIYPLDEGRVVLGGANISVRPMNARDIALVFQNYALFPHLTVFENIAFGLRMRKVKGPEIAERVAEALELVRMQSFERRKPAELSGGQQQRVALARAVVVRPKLLLLDEPLSNLDAKLRDEMRDEIRALQRQLKLTTVLVTHDLQEAFSVSDRVAIMREGRIEQVGTPADIYDEPDSVFVAGFVGHSNIMTGTVERLDQNAVSVCTKNGLKITGRRGGEEWRPGAPAWVTLRPERLKLCNGSVNCFPAIVEDVTYLGNSVNLRLSVQGETLRAHMANLGQALPRLHDHLVVSFNAEDVIVRPDASS